MLKIQVQDAGKRFQYEWIFRNLSFALGGGESLALTGSNGSGKSTLLKCIAGVIPLSTGSISYSLEGKPIPSSDWFSKLSIAAPYLELPEEFSLLELLNFHFHFKKSRNNLSIIRMLELLHLEPHRHKLLSQFSSGMKQRLKLGLALFSDVNLILLDEPTSNLDQQGILFFKELIKTYQEDRVLIISSNEPREIECCQRQVSLEDFNEPK